MTEKLYYADSYIKEFTARVVSCERVGDRCEVILDRTAFFPEGGGQAGDTGFIGELRVLDTQEKNGEVVHYTETAPEPGAELPCRIDWEQRFRRMQNHSGEHIVSGIVNSLYGYSNIGFHMGSDCVTIDFDGHLSPEQLADIERRANRAAAENRRIICSFPEESVLRELHYRSKLELTENVRIVEIEGLDMCACCAPHLKTTSEVGMIKILSSERRRRGGDGVRVSMLCGLDAFEYMTVIHDNNAAISARLSAKREETAAAVVRVTEEQEQLKLRLAALSRSLARAVADSIAPTEGNICVFDDVLPEPALRELVNALVPKCGGVAAAFSGSDGAYRYIMGSSSVDLRKAARSINAGIGGRGGGSPEMIQGSSGKCRKEIEEFFSACSFCIEKQ